MRIMISETVCLIILALYTSLSLYYWVHVIRRIVRKVKDGGNT